jgi:hypothetical protein
MLMTAHVGRAVRTAALALVVLGACAVNVAGQAAPPRNFHSGMSWGIGYSGTIPEAYFGAGGWHLVRGSRFGVFADGKVTLPSLTGHNNYCPPALQECTIAWVQQNRNDFDLRDENEWLIFNVGGLYAFYPEFALMLGGGMARLRGIREFVDPEEDAAIRITEEGNYFVPHFAEPSWTAQLTAGLLMRAGNRIAFSFGYETAPRGMTVGVFITP